MKRERLLKKDILKFTLLALVLICGESFGQISNIVSSVKVGDAKEKMPLSVSADLFAAENVTSIFIAYKSFGQSEFTKAEMLLAGNTASVTIPAESVQPPYLEYYLIINMKSGPSQTYPLGISEGVTPLQIAVSAFSQKDKEILVLSPTAGEMLVLDEMLISISLIKAPDNIDISKTKIYINGQDITSAALMAGDLLILSGENLISKVGLGSHLLKVDVFDKEGKLYHSISRSFEVVSAEVALAVSSRWNYNGYIKGESRSESFNSVGTWYNNIATELNGSVDQWRFKGTAYLTSEEKNNLQPFNRYSASIQNGDWLDLKVGDAFPRFPNLIMDGIRVRGISGALNLGFINVQATYGETIRQVEGQLLERFATNTLGSDIIPINKSKYNFPFGRVSMGTYSRKVFALRPSFGSGENFQFGFDFLHAKDDVSSIEFGARPQENLVLGTDLMFAFDNQNILFTSQAAVSVMNKDISSGNLTDTQIDSIFGKNSTYDIDPQKVKDIRNIISKFITVNQYLGPWNPQEFASVAAEAALSLNYFNNNVRASYIYRGNDYQSFGQSFIRTDVKGINIVDRIRMLDNKLFLSAGYERLQDNLQKTKVATTTYQTISASVSFFPRTDFPNITIGYNRYVNNNGFVLNLADTLRRDYVVDDITNRILIQLSYDFTAGIKHSSSLSFTTSKREDGSFANTDATFNTLTLTTNSFWTSQLTTSVGITYNKSEINRRDYTLKPLVIADIIEPFNYTSISIGARYRLLENKLQLSATLSPSFGDFKRQALDLIADYNVLVNLNLVFQARIYRIPDSATNSIIGLTTRLSI